MCLSTVYSGEHPDPDMVILEYVTNIDVDGNKICLYDIAGEKKEIIGTIHSIDLVRNAILINQVL